MVFNHWAELNFALVFLLGGLFVILYRISATQRSKNTRIALVTFGGILWLIYAVFAVAYVLPDAVIAVRLAFECVVVLLPATLFFLFIATRKESLFNQYAASLDRLGLLRKRQLRISSAQVAHFSVESDDQLKIRVKSYLDRFGAVYGTLPPANIEAFLATLDGHSAPAGAATSATGDSFYSFEVKTILPVFGATALIALGWTMVLPPFPAVPPSAEMGSLATGYEKNAWYLWAAEPVLLPVSFAFLGAYFFSLQMIVKRFMRRDLGPNAYNAVSTRIILATLAVWIGVQCIGMPADNHRGWLFALSFAVGVFPLIVWQLISNVLKNFPGNAVVLPNLEGTASLSEIDGLSVWHEARLEEEDIENVPNLATADIVDLMLNTKIAPNRIIDWVDQAILILVTPPKPEKSQDIWIDTVLNEYGIRTASSLVAATQPQNGNNDRVIDYLTDDQKKKALALANAVQLYPNYPLIQNWLSTEPFFPPTPA